MAIWLQSGKVLVTAGGKIIECAECPCDEFPTTELCSECPGGAPLDWTITVSGITNGSCSRCANYNGTWILRHHVSFPCFWEATESASVCGQIGEIPPWRFAFNGDENWFQLTAVTNLGGGSRGSIGLWFITRAEFDCLGSNVLAMDFTDEPNTQCADRPATITIAPAP